MNNLNSSIYLFPLHAIFNPEHIPPFETFDTEHSALLYSALTENYKEIFEAFEGKINSVLVFDEKDRDFLAAPFNQEGLNLFFGDTGNKALMLKNLSDKYFNNYTNNLLVFSNSICLTANDIQQALNLLSINDEAVVIGKTASGGITFLGFNTFNFELFDEIDWDNLNYDNFLLYTSKHEHFLHVIDNFLVIRNIEDFKNLYKELSKKESLSYCSQNMHEKFTRLFIEYKDLLK
jgi:glycosyltransferase A (GT-A) superfamily protein (DUF2064 family)